MRLCLLLLLLSSAAAAAPPDGGFHLEPKMLIDDVFGDAGDYRRIIDRFISLAEAMKSTRDEFARAMQTILQELHVPLTGNMNQPKLSHCPEPILAAPYARALTLGQQYLRAGRELTRYVDQVKEYDRLGETAGLTPDYRWKVKRVLHDYASLEANYREMKVSFHDQLAEELRFVGCDLEKLAARGGVSLAKEETWPSPEQPPPLAETKLEAPPPSAPSKVLPSEPIDLTLGRKRAGVVFYIDNSRCKTATHVTLDGRPLADVPGATRATFSTALGPHDLCLIPIGSPQRCGDVGTLRKSYLHEGWTIALRCD